MLGHANDGQFLGFRFSLGMYEFFDTLFGSEEFGGNGLFGRAWTRDGHFDNFVDLAWMGFEDEDAIGEVDGFVKAAQMGSSFVQSHEPGEFDGPGAAKFAQTLPVENLRNRSSRRLSSDSLSI